MYTPNLLLVKMKEKKLLKMQSLPKVLRSQAMRSTTYTYMAALGGCWPGGDAVLMATQEQFSEA